MCQPNTKQRILDSAEQLFAEEGFHATSLRNITASAEANLAAVNYHFGGKDALLEAVILRRLRPLNELRLDQLEAVLEGAAKTGEPPSCREVLRSFVEPTLRLRQQESSTEHFISLIGRTLADPKGFAMQVFRREMQPLMKRLFQALKLSLPGISQQELFWRVHFAIGSLSHLMRCHERHAMIPAEVSIEMPVEELIEVFLDFTVSGMEAKR